MLRTINVLGYSILNEPASVIAGNVCDHLHSGSTRSFVFLNPHSVVVAERDPVFRRAIARASGVLCDGAGLSLACRLLTQERINRIYGYEFFVALSKELSNRNQGRVLFLGGTHESLSELTAKYKTDFPGIPAVASYSPPFRDSFSHEDINVIANVIRDMRPEILWVGLGSPKQEIVLDQLMSQCHLPCSAAIGAVFDFYTGKVPYAPALIRRFGLQWLHRLALEPTRLWRRTVISGPLFAARVLRELATRG